MNMLPCGPLLKDSLFDNHTGSEAVISANMAGQQYGNMDSVNSVGYPGLKNGAYTIINMSLICHIIGSKVPKNIIYIIF